MFGDGYIRLAHAVIKQAIEDAINGSKEAEEFFDSDVCEIWCKVLGLNAENLKEAANSIIRRRRNARKL